MTNEGPSSEEMSYCRNGQETDGWVRSRWLAEAPRPGVLAQQAARGRPEECRTRALAGGMLVPQGNRGGLRSGANVQGDGDLG